MHRFQKNCYVPEMLLLFRTNTFTRVYKYVSILFSVKFTAINVSCTPSKTRIKTRIKNLHRVFNNPVAFDIRSLALWVFCTHYVTDVVVMSTQLVSYVLTTFTQKSFRLLGYNNMKYYIVLYTYIKVI